MPKKWVIGLVLGGLVLTTRSAIAGPEDPLACKCEVDLNGQGEESHYFPLFGSGTRTYKCDTAGCHINMVLLTCSSEHAGCTGTALGSEIDGDDNRASVIKLAARSDVVYNAERQALQLYGCNGGIAQHISVRDNERDAVLAIRVAMAY